MKRLESGGLREVDNRKVLAQCDRLQSISSTRNCLEVAQVGGNTALPATNSSMWGSLSDVHTA